MSKRIKLGALAVALLSALGLSLLFGVFRGDHSSLKQGRLDKASFMVQKGAASQSRLGSLSNKPAKQGNEASRGESAGGPVQEDVDNRAYPATRVAYKQVVAAQRAAKRLLAKTPKKKPKGGWEFVGPQTLNVTTFGTQTFGPPTQWSGRVTSMAAGKCGKGTPANSTKPACVLYVGAAGGGVWMTKNGLADMPKWTQISDCCIPSNAIGSILVDPTDKSGKTIYVGTGEPNGSSDSEAGIGLYKSTNFGKTWSLLPGSVPVSQDRAIGAIAVDPGHPNHLLIGTDVARHGVSSHNGGRFTPPDAPTVGLYESWDGGATWDLAFSQPQDAVDPSSSTGADYFLGGVTKIQFDPTDPSTYYFSMFGYGLFRNTGGELNTTGTFENIFYDDESASSASFDVVRFEFAAVDTGLAVTQGHTGKVNAHCTRIYLGAGWNEGGPHGASRLYRGDCVNFFDAGDLTTGGTNGGWSDMSSDDVTNMGFGSYDWCQTQCSYDAYVESPPGRPDTVVLGGTMQYGELPLYSGEDFSNGRAVVMSTDGAESFTDLTGDATMRPGGYFFDWEDMHPDQHAIVFDPANPDIMFFGSDGGVIRSNGTYTNNSSDCNNFEHRFIDSEETYDRCLQLLSRIPTKLITINAGLGTLQFESLSVDPNNPLGTVMGGTQDNGTLAYNGSTKWMLGVTGDGGDSTINASTSNIRTHTYTGTLTDTNFHGADPPGWDWTADPMYFSGEASSFYAPMTADPQQFIFAGKPAPVAPLSPATGRIFAGMDHIWRTNDSGGDQSYLDANCWEPFVPAFGSCGDWEPLGAHELNDSYYGSDKGADDSGGNYVVEISRTPADLNVLWAGTRRGRIFYSPNATGAAANVLFKRIDTVDTPTRFPSGIFINPFNPNEAWITFSGYNAYADAAGTADGHIFHVVVNPNSCTATKCSATWTNMDFDIGDQPVTDIAVDPLCEQFYISTDWGVFKQDGGSWVSAAPGLPPVATYGLTMDWAGRVLYAATHGRGAYRLMLPQNCNTQS